MSAIGASVLHKIFGGSAYNDLTKHDLSEMEESYERFILDILYGVSRIRSASLALYLSLYVLSVKVNRDWQG